ncbi:hypothetical protein [Pseudomonas syringae]|uniref:hypothetical protein n=1 Tax=Pseudomonas syringae TaxID=317 RepID=UPI000EFD71B9|nr:hypothetical protein [Pseudomonas syringae]MDC3739657.1 hypothetical protein [Pseudomonas syringae pv. syringae]RMN71517.1 hypothetical protein ALQ54_04282 [Pseudomonas syringae]
MASRREDKLLRTIQTKAPDGRIFEIREIQEYLINGAERLASFKRYEHSGGAGANLLENGDFDLVTIDVVVRPI